MLQQLFTHQAFVERTFVPIQLMLAMFGMGATLSVQEFTRIFRSPGSLAIGLLIQVVGVPLIAVALARLLGLGPGWAVGLILISVCPGGAFSNLLSFFARANVPLSISLTTVTTLGCLFTIPFVLKLTAAEHLPSGFQFPAGQIVKDIFAFLLTPLALGMLTFRLLPARAKQISGWSIRGSLFFVLLITLSSLGSGRIKVAEYGWGPPLTILGFSLLLSLVAPHVARLMRRYDDESAAMTIGITLRNTGIGLLLVRFFFPEQPENSHVLYSCLFWAGQSTPMSLLVVLLHRFGKSPALGRRRFARPAVVSQPS